MKSRILAVAILVASATFTSGCAVVSVGKCIVYSARCN